MAATNQELLETKNRLLEQLKRSDEIIAESIVRTRQMESKAFEFLSSFVAKLPEQKSQVDSTVGEENQTALQQYFKTLEDIEKCAQAMKRARQQQIDAGKI